MEREPCGEDEEDAAGSDAEEWSSGDGRLRTKCLKHTGPQFAELLALAADAFSGCP